MSHHSAIIRNFSRREAFATADPYSAIVLGYGSTQLYQSGVVCYSSDRIIRILDLHRDTDAEIAIDTSSLPDLPRDSVTHVDLMHYQDGILAACLHTSIGDVLAAIDTRDPILSSNRVVYHTETDISSRDFVRHDSKYLFYGSHTGHGSHGYPEWTIRPISLTERPDEELPYMQLINFFGSDLGSTVVFEIHDGYFYALSNQTTYDSEEVDWTSYYHCYRFPTDNPLQENIEFLWLWRRQHCEGPINDSWTELALHKSEQTGNLMVSECRREWLDGQSQQTRTFYTQPLIFPTHSPSPSSSDSEMGLESSSLPIGSHPFPAHPLIREDDKPHYHPPEVRLPRHKHPEFDQASGPSHTPAFLLAKTKYRAYNPNCSAFIDLVVDDNFSPSTVRDQTWSSSQLCLRVGSRILDSPYVDRNPGQRLHEPEFHPTTRLPVDGTEERFRDRGIKVWPSRDSCAGLLELLNPECRALGDIEARADDSGIVYTVGTGKDRKVVFVGFDPAIQFKGLRQLSGTSGMKAEEGRNQVVLGEGRNGGGSGSYKGKVIAEKELDDNREWIWREKAMWTERGRGFRLR